MISAFFAGIAKLNVCGPEWRIVFYFSLIATLVNGVAMLFEHIHAISWHGLFILLALGSCATFAQLALTRAYSTGKALVASGQSCSAVMRATLFGILLRGAILSPSSWAGMALVIASGVASLKLAPRH